jgi:tripartite-type tricarboxylate transporter receptor subunit TctC
MCLSRRCACTNRSTRRANPSDVCYITERDRIYKGSKLRALAVTTAARSEIFPVLPAMAEFVPGFEIGAWYGIGAPHLTPEAIIRKLNNEINEALADPNVKARLADLGGSPLPLSPAEFSKFISDHIDTWAN